MDDAQRIAQLIVQRLEEGHLDEKAGLEEIADQFELSSRQIRRIVQKELGVPPIQLLLTRRLLGTSPRPIALALSGGGDSLALLHLGAGINPVLRPRANPIRAARARGHIAPRAQQQAFVWTLIWKSSH